TAHKNNVKVVMSNHDFDKTPAKEEIVSRLTRMEALGEDLPKIAVMPKSAGDVLTLLDATNTVSEKANQPIITMS
ncbi:type I 3-dehydroquinate dehydratase, partial [Escherichia coli]|nr:type I 3-dehydroquinate dehydratase [Escherichia coli]